MNSATQVDKDGNKPPEIRLGKISGSGLVRLEFTNPMSFPSMEELIKLNQERSEKKLIDISIFSEDEENDASENLESWAIVKVDQKLIELQLVFSSPLMVSQGDTADKLIVQVGLSMYPD